VISSHWIVATVVFMATARVAIAQSGWERYAPGKLTSIIDRHRAEIDTSKRNARSFVVSTVGFPTKATLIFAGQTRPIPADHWRLLVMWARGVGIDTTRLAFYREEWLFREDTVEHWLPLQQETAESMRTVVAKGDTVTVWAQWFGAVTRGGRTTWLFPVMRAETYR
jgi:hypothetical protein